METKEIPQSGLKFIKASDRLPELVTTFNLKVYERCGFGKFYKNEQGEIELGFESMNGFGALESLHFDHVFWLEEAAPVTPVEEGWQPRYPNIWNTCIGHAISKAKLAATLISHEEIEIMVKHLESLRALPAPPLTQ